LFLILNFFSLLDFSLFFSFIIIAQLDISHVTAHQKKPTKVPVTLVVNKVTSVAIAQPVVTPTVVEISTTATIKCC